ncbi:methyltransferase domain-containing protein [Alteraurantiacibacter aquimixticola]|uniref:Methyltransferase domain-containing protein n=1 Tax=Alteraurantiacibacter aquimixticola TaxID=2489173 RepID=A0A4T3F5J6_9SPHN|nr:methyltransferase domain-containing protein [Alteraurantiacibacter aquimixticola]TIX50106.1 methyltransferase domain-containing protein [Alteraurantiacibacter aquimixticola]
MASAPPVIFAASRRKALRQRMLQAQRHGEDAPRFVLEDMIEDVRDRLSFVRHAPERSLVIGDWTGTLAEELGGEVVEADMVADGARMAINLAAPYPVSGFDFIACLGLLDTVNDLPGALVHIREALAPGGLAIASFVGGSSLSALRRIMLAADGDKPAARVHPMVDVRAGAQLLQRAGWADPVVDSHSLSVRYGSLERLVEDLRAQGLGSALASIAPALGNAGWQRARDAFAAEADSDGRVTESFEIVTLTGRRPKPRF